ncbi:hypothetical protein [Nocardia vaccinii]|uniref:hypothetical protein n=1 Tax=Nocardia vaccinii TaxID=1822 RepID=UPI000A54B4FC|nr:hypothetical protein [Nocardia vaccinii]
MTDSLSDPAIGPSRRGLLGTAVGALGAAAVAGAVRAEAAPARRHTPPSGNYRIDLHAHFLPPEYRASLLEHGHLTVGGYPTPNWSPEEAIRPRSRISRSRSFRCRISSRNSPSTPLVPPR